MSTSLKESNHVVDLRVDGNIISKWIFEKWGVKFGNGLNRLGLVSCCENGNEPPGFLKPVYFLNWWISINFKKKKTLHYEVTYLVYLSPHTDETPYMAFHKVLLKINYVGAIIDISNINGSDYISLRKGTCIIMTGRA